MKRFIKGFSVRYRLLLSLLLVALIPICSVLIVFYRYNVEELRKDVEQINLARVSQIRAGFERELKSHLSLRQAFCEDSSFLPLVKSGRFADQYDALVRMREYISYRSAGELTAILNETTREAFQRTGISAAGLYFTQLLQLEEAEMDRVEKCLAELPVTADRMVTAVKQTTGDQLLLFAYPLPPYTASDVVLVVPMTVAEITEIFSPLLGNLEGTAFLLDSQGNLLFSTGDAALAEYAQGLDYQKGSRVTSFQLEQEEYLAIYTVSSQAGLTYGMIAAENSYQNRIIKQTTLIWQMVLLALLACMIAVLLLTGMNYRPLKRLLDLSGSKSGGHMNEYEEIGNMVASSRERAERLEGTLEMQRPYVLERILGYALGAQLTGEQSRQLFSGMNLRFTHPCFFVISARALAEIGKEKDLWRFKTAVVETAEAMGQAHCACYSLERMEDNRVNVVINCSAGTDRKTYTQLFYQHVNAQLQADFAFVLGAGSLSHGFSRLKESLYESNLLTEKMLDRPVSMIEEMESLPSAFRGLYPVKDMLLFLQELREGDEKAALVSFSTICEASLAREESPVIQRHVCSYIIRSTTVTVRQLGAQRFEKEIEEMLKAETAEDLKRTGTLLIRSFCRMVNEDRKTSSSRLRQEMLTYMNENYKNPDLSLETLAEAFQLSPYYISRFFRDQNNMNFKDYIASLRIDQAREWLVETDKPVAEIVSDLGYLSTSSFIRKFKATTGMTPGNYRASYGNQKRSEQNE